MKLQQSAPILILSFMSLLYLNLNHYFKLNHIEYSNL